MRDRTAYLTDEHGGSSRAESALAEVLDIVEHAETNCTDDEPRPELVDAMLDDLLMTVRRALGRAA